MRNLICVPAMDTMHTLFVVSLLGLAKGGAEVAMSSSSLVYDARNQLAEKAVNNGYDRVLWLDSDMQFQPDLLARLSAHLDNGLEMVCGLYFTRKAPIIPVIYKTCDRTEDGKSRVVPYEDYPDGIFPVEACGFGAVMMTTDLILRIGQKFGPPFSPEPGFGEDFSFCRRARAVGARIYCDSRIKVDHIGLSIINETTWKTRGV